MKENIFETIIITFPSKEMAKKVFERIAIDPITEIYHKKIEKIGLYKKEIYIETLEYEQRCFT